MNCNNRKADEKLEYTNLGIPKRTLNIIRVLNIFGKQIMKFELETSYIF